MTAVPHECSDSRGGSTISGGQAGLTLVEVIVALALSALVVAFLAEGTGLLRQFGRIGRAVSAQDEVLTVRDHLRRTVESAMRSAGPSQGDGFAGVGDTAVFTVPGDRLLETGGPVRITLAAVPDGQRLALVETRAPVGAPNLKGRTRRLLTGAAQVQFAYFGTAGEDRPTWVSEWTDPESGPALMRIDVVFPRGDARHWPLFVAPMPTGGETGTAQTAQPTKADAAKPPGRSG